MTHPNAVANWEEINRIWSHTEDTQILNIDEHIKFSNGNKLPVSFGAGRMGEAIEETNQPTNQPTNKQSNK